MERPQILTPAVMIRAAVVALPLKLAVVRPQAAPLLLQWEAQPRTHNQAAASPGRRRLRVSIPPRCTAERPVLLKAALTAKLRLLTHNSQAVPFPSRSSIQVRTEVPAVLRCRASRVLSRQILPMTLPAARVLVPQAVWAAA